MSNDKEFDEWFEINGESGIHLEGLSPKEYGQAIWATMEAMIEAKNKEAEQLRKVNERYKKTLEFYADVTNYYGVRLNTQDFNTLVSEMRDTDGCTMNIGGVRARQTLGSDNE